MTLALHLSLLESSNLIRLAQLEPEVEYLFRHALVQDATYASTLWADRKHLHLAVAEALERLYPNRLDDFAAELGEHYRLAGTVDRASAYFIRAGDAARLKYANAEALMAYTQALNLTGDAALQIDLHLKKGAVLELTGQWIEAQAEYTAALRLSETSSNPAQIARCQQALGNLASRQSDYEVALGYLESARLTFQALDDRRGLGQVLTEIGGISSDKGDFDEGRRYLEESLALARSFNDQPGMAAALHSLGRVAFIQGDHLTAHALFSESLALRRSIGDKRPIGVSLNALGSVAARQGEVAEARILYNESLTLARELGDRGQIALLMGNLGKLALRKGDYIEAQALYRESQSIYQEMGDKQGFADSFAHLGLIAYEQGDYEQASLAYEKSLSVFRVIGDKSGIASLLASLGDVICLQDDYLTAQGYFIESLKLAWEMGDQPNIAYDLVALGAVATGLGHYQRAVQLWSVAEPIREAVNIVWGPAELRLYERALPIVRAHLSEAEFKEIWQSAQKMSIESVIALEIDRTDAT